MSLVNEILTALIRTGLIFGTPILLWILWVSTKECIQALLTGGDDCEW